MSYPVANLNIASDTFAVWVTRTNTLLNALSNYVVTVDNSASGNSTVGSGYVHGSLGADYITVGTKLRGGNVATNTNMTVESNTTFERNVNIAGNLTVNGDVVMYSNLTVLGVTSFSGNIAMAGFLANGTYGTNGQVLTTNGAGGVYWGGGTGTVTDITAGNGLAGGTIAVSGTVSIRANTGLIANSTGLYVNNTTISSLVGGFTANNANHLGGVAAASYQLNSTLSANVAKLTANNATYLNGTPSSDYQLVSTLSANVAGLTSNNTVHLNNQPASYYTNATNLSTGTVPTARLATSGTANASTFLRGDQVWASIGGGGTVTDITAGSGLAGGTITGSGTISVLANSGIVSSSSGVAVNTAFIGTLSANNTTYLNGQLASYYLDASNLSTGIVPTARLASTGTPSSTTFLRGDQTWATISGGGTVTSVGSGTGLTGGPITSTGTLSLATAGAGAATYINGISSISVDAYGRVTSVTGTANYGSGTVTSISAGTGLSGGTITGSGTISLSTPVSLSNGGTGGSSAATARSSLGVPNIAGDTITGKFSYTAAVGIFMNGSSFRMYQDSTSSPGVGNSTAGGSWQYNTEGGTIHLSRSQFAGLRMNQNTSGDNFVDFYKSGTTVGAIVLNGSTGVLYNTASDYRLKEDLLPVTNAIDAVVKTPVYNFRWKNTPEERMLGFLAHEAQAAVPGAVSGTKDGEEMQMVDYGKMVPMLWAAVQELTAKVKELEAQLEQK